MHPLDRYLSRRQRFTLTLHLDTLSAFDAPRVRTHAVLLRRGRLDFESDGRRVGIMDLNGLRDQPREGSYHC